MENEIQQCGYCGRYFKGLEFLTAEELNTLDFNKTYELGYCPDAEREHYEQNPPEEKRYVTRDMAIDAGDPTIEGMEY